MDLSLERGDLLQLDAISNRGTLRLLPLGKKGKQKLVIGDDSGYLNCYEFKRGEPQQVFTARVFEDPITTVAIGGISEKQDKIFLASGQRIVGITKKGKEFFKLTSSLTETIHNIGVEDNRLWTSCEYIYNMYSNGVDKEFYMCKDLINDMALDHVTKEQDFDVIFACQDNCIRFVHGSQLLLEIPTDAPVTTVAVNKGFASALQVNQGGGDSSSSTRRTGDAFGMLYVVYGMENGGMGMAQVRFNGASAGGTAPILSYISMWTLEDWSRKRSSAITALKVCDITKNGFCEIVVGRDDGRVEVYAQMGPSLNNNPYAPMEPPVLQFSRDIGESVRSLECGFVNSSEFYEIIVAAYSGKIISFTTEPVQARAQDDKHGRSLQTINDENRIKHLRAEVDGLKSKVDKEKEKMKKMSTVVTDIVANTVMDFPVNSKFLLDTDHGIYTLTVELQVAIDLVLIRSPVLLDLVEAEVGSSTIAVSNQTGINNMAGGVGADASAPKFFASFRCQGSEKRIRLNLRSTEGEYGDMDITIVTAGATGKTSSASSSGAASPANGLVGNKSAKTIKFSLKPLSLHSRINSLTEVEQRRPMHKLQFTGNTLILSMISTWLQALLPDIPHKLVDDEDNNSSGVGGRLYFRNVFTQAVAVVEFRSKELTFECECISTIAIIKENITRLATYHRVNIAESLDLKDAAIETFLGLLQGKLTHQISLAKSMQIMEAIQEIIMQDGAGGAVTGADGHASITKEKYPWLAAGYIEIAQNQDSIRRDYKQRVKSLEYLCGIITDLYVDYCKLKRGGVDKRTKLPELHRLIYTADMESICNFFLYGMA